MSRVRTTVATLLASAVVLAGAAHPAQAATTDRSFAAITTLPFHVDALSSPDADTVIAAGRRLADSGPGRAVVAARVGGTWVRQELGVDADWVKAVSDDGITYVLTGTDDHRYTLWQTVGKRLVQMPLPSATWRSDQVRPTSIAVDGHTLAVGGTIWSGTDTIGSGRAFVAVRTGAQWATYGFSKTWDDYGEVDLLGLRSSRLVLSFPGWVDSMIVSGMYVYTAPANGAHNPDNPYDTDLPLTWFGQAAVRPSGSADGYPAAAVRTGWDFTLWGSRYTYSTGDTLGLCKRFAGGDASACPTPSFGVDAVATMVDGRTVLAGDNGFGDEPSGFAVVSTAGAVSPIAGDASDVTAVTAAQIGARAWVATSPRDYLKTAANTSTILETDLAG